MAAAERIIFQALTSDVGQNTLRFDPICGSDVSNAAVAGYQRMHPVLIHRVVLRLWVELTGQGTVDNIKHLCAQRRRLV